MSASISSGCLFYFPVLSEIPWGWPIYHLEPDAGRIKFLYGDKPQEFFGHEACLVRNPSISGLYAIRTILDMPLSQMLKHKVMFESSISLEQRNMEYYRNGPYLNERIVGVNCGTLASLSDRESVQQSTAPSGLGITGIPISSPPKISGVSWSSTTGTRSSGTFGSTPATAVSYENSPPVGSPFSTNKKIQGYKESVTSNLQPHMSPCGHSSGYSSRPGSSGQLQPCVDPKNNCGPHRGW